MIHKIGLVEALCGFKFMVRHLDGRQIVAKYPAGKIIEPGSVCVVRGQGMPQHQNPSKGDLFIKMIIQFPKNSWLSPKKLAELEELLPPRSEVPMNIEDTEEVDMEDYNSSQGPSSGGRNSSD